MKKLSSSEYWDIFLAHAGPDKAAAEILYDLLVSSGYRVFLDTRCLKVGDDWPLELAEAQRNSKVTVVLISSRTEKAYYQREEIAAAVSMARENRNKHRVVPVYLDHDDLIRNDLPYGLRLRHGLSVSEEGDLPGVAKTLVDAFNSLYKKPSRLATKRARATSTDKGPNTEGSTGTGSQEAGRQRSFAERLRNRRDELGITRSRLEEAVRTMGGSISVHSIRKMEKTDRDSYRLPKRKRGTTLIEHVARPLGVPLGYLLAGYSKREIEESAFGDDFKKGRITLIDTLDEKEGSFADFLKALPTDESSLLRLPLYSFRNERAFAIIFRLEQIYSGLEMLIVNEPPLIFWDESDIRGWIGKMGLLPEDHGVFYNEFLRYRSHFRERAQKGKHYKIVLNESTFIRFMAEKPSDVRGNQIDDIIRFLGFRTFNLVLYKKAKASDSFRPTDDALTEEEVISKHRTIPDSLEDTLSVVIRQTPSHQTPVEYFVAPAIYKDKRLLQKDKTRIDEKYAEAVDLYEQNYKKSVLPEKEWDKELDDEAIKRVTQYVLLKIKTQLRHL